MIAQSEHAKCLTPECGGIRSVRGLCQACYHAGRRLVGEHKATWEELEGFGLALPTTGRRVSQLCEALTAARATKQVRRPVATSRSKARS